MFLSGYGYKDVSEKVAVPNSTLHNVVEWILSHVDEVEAGIVDPLRFQTRCKIAWSMQTNGRLICMLL
jgi:hypothetical protein